MKALSKYCFIVSLTIQLFDYSFSFGQSKKEQIEDLNYQRDSLELLLIKNKDLYFSEINDLKLERNSLIQKVNDLSYANQGLIEKNKELKNQLLSLNQKLDSLFNLKYGQQIVPLYNPEEHNDDCISNYFFNSNTIELPRPTELTNYSFNNILPVGWSEEGVFAYNWVSEDVCGMCSVGLDFFDAKNNTELPSFGYNLEEFGGDEENNKKCDMIQRMRTDYKNGFEKYTIVPISNLKMNYINNVDGGLLADNRIFKIERSNGKGRLIMINQLGDKKVLHEEILKKVYSDYYLHWCEDDMQINGGFYNPLNKKQFIIHLYKIVPCGFENEDEYSSIFVSINL